MESPLRIFAIIQARMSSSRLPGKVLLDIAGKPMLLHVVERARRARSLTGVVVATTTDPSDDAVEQLCRFWHIDCTRGSVHDVLDRYYQAARQFQADVIVRITADCPLIAPELIDEAVNAFVADAWDFAANRLPPPWGRTYPIGLDTEVCSWEGLKTAWEEAVLPYQREHVMPFFYDQPQRFRILHLNLTPPHPTLDTGSLRWTVDTPEDLELLRQIFAHFPSGNDFSWREVLTLVEQHPELREINAGIRAKNYQATDERYRIS